MSSCSSSPPDTPCIIFDGAFTGCDEYRAESKSILGRHDSHCVCSVMGNNNVRRMSSSWMPGKMNGAIAVLEDPKDKSYVCRVGSNV